MNNARGALLILMAVATLAWPQSHKVRVKDSGNGNLVARGKYIVEGLAVLRTVPHSTQ
jgi:hypothetical protein